MDGVDALRDAIADTLDRDQAAAAFYEHLKARKQIKSHLLVTYRCPRRCTLIQVLTTKAGIIVHRKRYKLSPARNSRTGREGRAKNTEDGDRRWKGHTLMLSSAANLVAQCDHLDRRVVSADQIRADIEAGHADITLTAQIRPGVLT